MKVDLDELKLEDILCKGSGDLRHDSSKLVNKDQAFNIKEFLFIYYGNSNCKKSRIVAEQLNEYVSMVNEDNGNCGLRRQKEGY